VTGGFRKVGEEAIYSGYVIRVTVSHFVGPKGEEFQRDVVHTRGAVAVVPIEWDPEGAPLVVLVRQYRAPLEATLLEIPAGMRDVEGEAPEATARRELAEEIGMEAATLEPLVHYVPAAGFTDQRTQVFLGVDLKPCGAAAHGVEEEYMTIERHGLADAIAMIDSGQIVDGKTIIGLLMARDRLGS